MGLKLPGVEALGKQIAGATTGLSKTIGNNIISPILSNINGNGGFAGIRGSTVGQYAGNLITGKIKEEYRGVVSKVVGKVGSKVGKQILGSMLNNLMSNGYGTGQLADLVRRGDPHLLIDWSVILPTLKGMDPIPDAYVEGIDLASSSFGARRIQIGTSHVNFPGYLENTPITITFAEDTYQTVGQYLNWWRNCIRNPDGTYNYPVDYKANIMVIALTPDGKPAANIELVGCYPEGPASYPYASGTSDYVKIHQSFACDRVVFSYPPRGVVSLGPVQDISKTITTGDAEKDAVYSQVTIT